MSAPEPLHALPDGSAVELGRIWRVVPLDARITEATGHQHPSRVVVWYGREHCSVIPCTSDEAARAYAAELTALVNAQRTSP